jgi:hypothetical protein
MKSAVYVFVLGCLALVVVSVVAQDEINNPCFTYQQCSEMGTKDLKAGKIDEAIRLFKLQGTFAEVADIEQGDLDVSQGKTRSYSLRVLAYNNLTVAYMRKGNNLVARLWCHVALRWEKNNKAALLNLGQIQKGLEMANWVWPDSVEGGYLQYSGWGGWNILSVRRNGQGEYSISFFGAWNGQDPKSGPSGIGEFHTRVVIAGHSAVYRGDAGFPCTVQMDFSADKVILKQDGNCGFGHNVEANGIYERANTTGELPDGGFPIGNFPEQGMTTTSCHLVGN